MCRGGGNKNWYTYSLLCYKLTSRIRSTIGEKSQKTVLFLDLFHFMYTKAFEVNLPVNGSLIDDKNIYQDLKLKIFLKTLLFCVKGQVFPVDGNKC